MLKRFKQPLIIVSIYVLVGVVWVSASSSILNSFVDMDIEGLRIVTFWIRMSFIVASAVLLLFLYSYFQKKLEQKITDYTNLFDNNPNPMWIIHPRNRKFLAVNKTCLLKYGYSEEEFLSKTIYDIRSTEESIRLKKHLDERPDGFQSEGIWEHQKKNGELFYVEVSSNSIKWNNEDAILIVLYDISVRNMYETKLMHLNQELENQVLQRTKSLDAITQELATSNEEISATNEELVAANEELHAANEHQQILQLKIEEQAQAIVRQSEEKLNRILSSLKDVVWSANITGGREFQIDYINDAVVELYGYYPQDFINDSALLRKLVYTEDLDIIKPAQQTLLNHQYAKYENRIQDKFGNIKWISSRLWLTKDNEGRPVRIDGIVTNIDDQKKAELELTAQKDKLQRVFDNLPLMLVQFDSSGKLLFANMASEKILGWTFQEMTSHHNMLEELYPNKKTREDVINFMTHGGSTWGDFKMTVRNGATIDSSWTNVRLKDGSLIGIGQDITRRKEEEKEKENLIEQLVEQNNDVLQFSFISSHNLRGPIATMLGLMQLVEKDKINDPQLLHIFNYLEKSVVKLEEVIRDLTKILEIRGLQSEPKEEVDINEVLTTVQQILMAQLATNNISLTIDTSAAHSFFTIRSYLHSILYNLITNSIKFRNPEQKLSIKIKTFENGSMHGFSIEDNGLGIDLERFQTKIFTLYQRFHPHVEGKGLGLYLIKTQLGLLKGVVEVKSIPGAGSTFTVSFPR